jgi:hypothetical protein
MPEIGCLDAISEVKGFFNRVARQDQWGWFTVARQLGYPSTRISQVIASYLGDLRIPFAALGRRNASALSASAKSLSVEAPAFWISRMMGSTLAA